MKKGTAVLLAALGMLIVSKASVAAGISDSTATKKTAVPSHTAAKAKQNKTIKEESGFKKSPTGLRYKLFGKNDGRKANVGDLMTMRLAFSAKTADNRDTLMFDSNTQGPFIRVPLQVSSFKGSIEEAFGMMGVGDSACFLVPADSLFVKSFHSTVPPTLKPSSDIFFKVKLLAVTSREEMKAQQLALQKEKQAKETKDIEKYLADKKLDIKPDADGVYYLETKAGSGNTALNGQTADVNYTGRFLDGRVFDTSVESVAKESGVYTADRPYNSFQVQIGQNSVITGWELALKKMKPGTKATIILPSSLAYGASGAGGSIPPYTPLLFEIEVLSIK